MPSIPSSRFLPLPTPPIVPENQHRCGTYNHVPLMSMRYRYATTFPFLRVRPIATCVHLMPTLQGSNGEERQQRPEEIIKIQHPRERTAAVVLAAFILRAQMRAKK